MVVGVGVDIVSVNRIKVALIKQGERLEKRVFSENELKDCGEGAQRWQRLASRFAAKEATMKSLSTGLWQVAFTDIVVTREPSGKPEICLLGRALEKAKALGVSRVHISMSHESEHAVAFATAVSGDSP